MNNILLLLTNVSENIDYDALTAQAMMEMPVWQVFVIGIISSVLFLGVFVLVFMLISYILNFILILMDKYYEKTGKKRPIKKYKNKNRRNF